MKITLKFLLALALPALLMVSCGEDEPKAPNEPNAPIENEPETPGQNSDFSESSIEALINKSIYINSSYTDYTFTFTISSVLSNKLPSDVIEYGVGHCSTSFSEETPVSVGDQAYYYSESSDGRSETIVIKNPFWFYYIFVDSDYEKWTTCEMYYNSYIELRRKGYNNLSRDEKQLYNEVTSYLDDCQKEVKRYYRPAIYVVVNSKFYKIKSYQIP